MGDDYKKQMTDSEAIKYLASKIGEMRVTVADRWRIDYKDGLSEMIGSFGFKPEYGETFDDALRSVIISKYGNHYIEVANNMKLAEEVSNQSLVRILKKRFPD